MFACPLNEVDDCSPVLVPSLAIQDGWVFGSIMNTPTE
nr:unknown [Picea sitchensis]